MRLSGRLVASLASLAASITFSTTASAVQGGAEDRSTLHSVVIVTGGPASPVERCSGTLLSPNVVLTVRHCIAPLPVDGASCEKAFGEPVATPGDFWVDASPWVMPGLTWKRVASWEVPAPTTICGNDIALLVLATPFAGSEATPARPVLTRGELLDVARRRTFGIAAFGATIAGGTDTGTRRSRFDVPIKCLPGEPGFACDGALGYLDMTELTGGAGPCSGDSGAGAIVDGDRGAIFGVLSRGSVAGESCTEGVFERTDVWRWLLARTVLRATPAGAVAPEWARAAFPERPAIGELCLDAAACGEGADCVSLDGRRSFTCARRCSAGCGDGEHCESNVCVRGAVADGSAGGCAITPSAPRATSATSVGSASAVGLGLVLFALRIFSVELATLRRRRLRGRGARRW